MIDGIPNRPLYFYQKDIIGYTYSEAQFTKGVGQSWRSPYYCEVDVLVLIRMLMTLVTRHVVPFRSMRSISLSLQVHWSSLKSVAEDNAQLPNLVMTNIHSHGFSMALIEIYGLPFLIAWWIFPVRYVSQNQMVPVNGTWKKHFWRFDIHLWWTDWWTEQKRNGPPYLWGQFFKS